MDISFSLDCTWLTIQDKSADVRKAAEAFFNELLRVCGQEMVCAYKIPIY